MSAMTGKKIVKLLALVTLSISILAGCQPGDSAPPASGGSGAETGNGKRKLTVVKGEDRAAVQGVAIERIHQIKGANIEKWLSDHVVRVMTTRLTKEATPVEEAEYAYEWSIFDLATGEQHSVDDQSDESADRVIKEFPSPDGKFSFVQLWEDKYAAVNSIKDIAVGTSRQIEIANYMEVGGWLDNTSYVLAAGSMDGRGDIWQIFVDGTYRKLELEDQDVDNFVHFSAADGYIYYVDANSRLKRFSPSQSRPTELAANIDSFTLSPDGKAIAASTSRISGKSETELLVYDTTGHLQGSLIGKGDVLPYVAWSPNSARLAFAVYTEDQGGMNGVYIFDSVSGEVSPVGPTYYPLYPLSWNSSSTRLGITIEDNENLIVTQIIDFK
ncbi:hypothetical protein EBB07_16950 [Paenibacillaceae bacterium]|nr:hypothetical protein EBB07_16950 [Paenibacillaceae bacterium]